MNTILKNMSLYRPRPHQPPGLPESCLPTSAKVPPNGPDWIHEIKHDGFRVMARRVGSKVNLISRKGRDLTYRFPLVAAAVAQLPVQSCLIDGEVILCDDNGLTVFQLLRSYRNGHAATFCAFDWEVGTSSIDPTNLVSAECRIQLNMIVGRLQTRYDLSDN